MREEKILVIIDMQKDFTTGVLGNKECEASIAQVVDVVRDGDYDRILLTRDTHHEDYMETREGKHLPIPHCIEGTDGWNVTDEVMDAVKEKLPAEKIKIFDKPTFGSLELGEYLRELDAEAEHLTVDFVGVCTGICVISNVAVVKAGCPEADVRVIEKACACVTPDTHNTAIEAMKTFQVEIV